MQSCINKIRSWGISILNFSDENSVSMTLKVHFCFSKFFQISGDTLCTMHTNWIRNLCLCSVYVCSKLKFSWNMAALDKQRSARTDMSQRLSVVLCFVLMLSCSIKLPISYFKCWQGGSWPNGLDPALFRSSTPASRRTWSSGIQPATWCHLTWLASPSCPMTAASKETCHPVLIPLCHLLWTALPWMHHGNNAEGNFRFLNLSSITQTMPFCS